MRVCYKNTFLSIEANASPAAQNRAHSAESIRSSERDRRLRAQMLPFEHQLDELNRSFVAKGGDQTDVTVWQTPPDESGSLMDTTLKPNKLLATKTLSCSSVSTMASSSDSVSSLASDVSEGNVDSDSDVCPAQMPPGNWDPMQHPVKFSLKDSKHSTVPKTVNLAEEYAKKSRSGALTTIMIRNVPNRYSQRELINELKALGFAGTFDFLYVPLDLGTMSNVGYAFVNFTEAAWAEKCMDVLQNHRFKRHRQVGKVAAVSVAHIQGLEANLKHYEKSAVNTSRLRQRRPVIIANMSSLI